MPVAFYEGRIKISTEQNASKIISMCLKGLLRYFQRISAQISSKAISKMDIHDYPQARDYVNNGKKNI